MAHAPHRPATPPPCPSLLVVEPARLPRLRLCYPRPADVTGPCLWRLQLVNPEISKYRDRRFEGSQEDFERALRESTTVYVGNLSFFTTEEQIYEASALSIVASHWRWIYLARAVPERAECPIGAGTVRRVPYR